MAREELLDERHVGREYALRWLRMAISHASNVANDAIASSSPIICERIAWRTARSVEKDYTWVQPGVFDYFRRGHAEQKWIPAKGWN